MLHVMCVAGARPNFMKVAALMDVARQQPDLRATLVHTGQHYDRAMSQAFFEELEIPKPDVHLGVGSGSHAVQTARVLERFAETLEAQRPDIVVVVGDVNSTLACTLAAVKMGIPVAHVEAGLRSFDRKMPEEINRVLTDAVSSVLFTTERSANENLLREGVDEKRIHFVGNVMIDTLLRHRQRAASHPILAKLELQPGEYAVLTLHRPSNVDDEGTLRGVLQSIVEIARVSPVVFPCHPRTLSRLQSFGLEAALGYGRPGGADIRVMEPLSYLPFLRLIAEAGVVLTDSGGIQEETTILGVPCVTLRASTERPVTLTEGTNVLVGTDPERIRAAALAGLRRREQGGRVPELWDGRASERIAAVLRRRPW